MIWRAHNPSPDRERVFAKEPCELRRIKPQIVEDMSFQMPVPFVVTDELDPSDLSASVVEVEPMQKEEAPANHSKVDRPRISSFVVRPRSFKSQEPTSTFKAWSAGLGVGCCVEPRLFFFFSVEVIIEISSFSSN